MTPQGRRFGFLCQLADFFHHVEGGIRAGINSKPNRRAAQPQRVVDGGGDRLVGRFLFGASELELLTLRISGICAGERIRARFQHAQRRGIGRKPASMASWKW